MGGDGKWRKSGAIVWVGTSGVEMRKEAQRQKHAIKGPAGNIWMSPGVTHGPGMSAPPTDEPLYRAFYHILLSCGSLHFWF